MRKIRQLELLVMLLGCMLISGMAVIGFFDEFAAVVWFIAWVPGGLLGLAIAAHMKLKGAEATA